MKQFERKIRTFYLLRVEDPSGVSGTGLVAEGVVFTNGKVAVSFVSSDVKSIVTYDNIEDAERIHGHGGLTLIVYDDDDDLLSKFKHLFGQIVTPFLDQGDIDEEMEELNQIREGPAGKNGLSDDDS